MCETTRKTKIAVIWECIIKVVNKFSHKILLKKSEITIKY